jgi:hypothetical protein
MEGHSSNENRFQMNWDSKILLNCPTPRKVTPIIRQLFSSPDPKGHVRYCHHLASVVCPSSVR